MTKQKYPEFVLIELFSGPRPSAVNAAPPDDAHLATLWVHESQLKPAVLPKPIEAPGPKTIQ